MKKSFLSFLFLYCIHDAFSQQMNDSLKLQLETVQPYHLTFKTNPLTLMWGCIPFTSELKLQNEFIILPHQSIQIGVSYLGKGWPLKLAENEANRTKSRNNDMKIYARGLRFQYAHRFYLYNKKYEYMDEYAPIGIYCGPMISYANAKIGTKNNPTSNYYIEASNFQLCWMTGYQGILVDNFIFDLYFGMGYKNNELVEHNKRRGLKPISTKDIPFYGSNFKLVIGGTIGIALK